MSRNKKAELIIARFLTAVFLFVLISSPISVYASGDSASDNDSDEEYETWSDAFNDSEYTENLAENIARTWATYFVTYVGTRENVVEEVADYIGDTYDRTISLYDNIYSYILPYSRQTVTNIDGANLSIGTYGKPIRNKNNIKLINDYTKTMENSLPNTFVNIAKDKHKTGEITFNVFPSYLILATHPFNETTIGSTHSGFLDPCLWAVGNVPNSQYKYDVIHPLTDNGVITVFRYRDYGNAFNASLTVYDNQGNTLSMERDYLIPMNGWSSTSGNYIQQSFYWGSYKLYLFGSGYIEKETDSGFTTYYWDLDSKTLFYMGTGRATSYFGDSEGDYVGDYNVNIINSVDFTEYNDLINQLMLDVNLSNTITNSLLIELLTELRNQRDVYQPTSDSDDIYNYIDYMMNKLLEVKDIHIEIPDLTPDMGGIVDGITALLNFLASIIRTIGGIVQSLLEGLVHLFVPSQEDWDDINIQFETLTAPFGWIKEFIAEAASNISLLLFGRNVTDFDVAETEDVDLVMGEGGLDPDIVYDPTSGAPKIPVRFSNSSSEYFSCIEDAYIIDMSWYAPYKPVGDIIVVAFCWLCFIWRVLHDLPGIISGSSGILDNSYHDQDQEWNRYDTWHNLIGK